MIDINKMFILQLANFLLLMWLLNILLFKPLLKLFKERDFRINGSLDSAKSMDGEKDAIFQQIDTKLSEARSTSKTIFEDLKKEGLAIQKESVEAAQKGASEISRKAKEDLETETNKAKESLRKNIEVFSKKIVEKMVGV